MPQQSSHQVALITGAARRIGAEIAAELHRAGMNVAIHYRTSAAEAQALADRFNRQRNDSAMVVKAHLSDVDYYAHLCETVHEQWGRLDVLVNNASCFFQTPLANVTPQAWQELMNTNLQAPLFLAQQAAPYLAEQQGSVINITDIHAEKPLKHYSVYCMTKAGLVMMTKALAQELGPQVRVNAVAPGAIMWPEQDNSLSPQQKDHIIQQTAVKRHGSSQHIAQSVRFLIENSYITGHVLAVDGGRYLG